MTGVGQTETGTELLDTAAMRAVVRRVLAAPSEPPTPTKVAALTVLLRSHMDRLMPEVERLAARLPKDDIPRYCALACLGEARQKRAAQPSPAPGGDIAYARRLARTVNALADHYETLTGVTMCLACDQPINGEESLPYNHMSQSGGAARAGHVHARCANTVRRG